VTVPTLVFDPLPTELQTVLERRHQLEQDRRDEVWQGVLHMIPPPSVEHERLAAKLVRLIGPLADAAGLETTLTIGIGTDEHDYRVPDLALLRAGYAPQWNPTAALVCEIVSPGDKSWDKLSFYAAHQIDEVVVVDFQQKRISWLSRNDDRYQPIERSAVIDLDADQLGQQLGRNATGQ
jgi:Uma2 family endonuclease